MLLKVYLHSAFTPKLQIVIHQAWSDDRSLQQVYFLARFRRIDSSLVPTKILDATYYVKDYSQHSNVLWNSCEFL
jgi:hypothetical protein